jgi:serine/threonine protein kinase
MKHVKAKFGEMPIELVLDIVQQILTALQSLHKRSFLHRDLKP